MKEYLRKAEYIDPQIRVNTLKEYLKKAEYIDPQIRVNALKKKLNNLPETSSDDDSEDNQISNFVDKVLKKVSKEIVNDDNKKVSKEIVNDDNKKASKEIVNDDNKKVSKEIVNDDNKKNADVKKKSKGNITEQIKKMEASENLFNKQIRDAKKILQLSKKYSESNAKTNKMIKELRAKTKDREEVSKNTDKVLKENYTKEAQNASEEIEKYNEMINDNLDMSSEKSEIINKLIELYSLIQIYYLNKIDNNLKANENIDNISIESDIWKLKKRLRELPKTRRGVFTSQKEFAKLLTFLVQLFTNNSSKKLISDTEQLINNLYDNKQITKQVHNMLNKSTRKEQVKILDDKIEANNAQYNLDRMNAEISAYSSGDLPKYKYLTKKYLGYKPDAFEQAKFEYSPSGKVFTGGLDKSDKNEGLLKRLKNIEDRSNNKLLTIQNISRPAIKGENNGNVSDEYKTIQDFKQELIEKNILHLDGVKKFDNIIDKWKQTKDKEIVYKNVDTKVNTKKFNIYKVFENYLNKKSDYHGKIG